MSRKLVHDLFVRLYFGTSAGGAFVGQGGKDAATVSNLVESPFTNFDVFP